MPAPTTEQRASVYAALGDPVRLRIVDELAVSDRSPHELTRWLGIPSNLLAHHLGVLAAAGLIERTVSAGDARRRYVRLAPERLTGIWSLAGRPPGEALFVCSQNSARSQLAAALWEQATAEPALSAGTHPAPRVHPGAVAAADRAGLNLAGAVPSRLDGLDAIPPIVVTVCDRAHEEIPGSERWLHWSIPDPAGADDPAAFDAVLLQLRERIGRYLGRVRNN